MKGLVTRLSTRLGRMMYRYALGRRIGGLFLRYAPGQLTCAEFERFVYDYHEGQLSGPQRMRFERHMAICPFCVTHFKNYVKAVEMGRQLFALDELDEPAPLPEELVIAILSARE